MTIKEQLNLKIKEGFINVNDISKAINTHPNNVLRRLKNQRWQTDEIIAMKQIGFIK